MREAIKHADVAAEISRAQDHAPVGEGDFEIGGEAIQRWRREELHGTVHMSSCMRRNVAWTRIRSPAKVLAARRPGLPVMTNSES